MHQKLIMTLLGVVIICSHSKIMAQSRGYLMPWIAMGIDAHTSDKLKLSFEAGSKAISQKYMNNSKVLKLDRDQYSLNTIHHSRNFIEGDAKTGIYKHLFIQPILCKLSDQLIVSVQAGNLESGILSYSELREIPFKLVKEGKYQDLQTQITGAIQSFKAIESREARSALKLRLALKRSSNDSTVGANHCPNLVLGKNLSGQYRIQQVVGTENTKFVQRLLAPNSKLSRHNRTIHIDWRLNRGKPWTIYTELSESVFGNKIYPGLRWNLENLTADSIAVPKNLANYLALEEKALSPIEAPRVASIYGAWAYLDKGRAWGLKMNDRVYVETAEKRVKGHVVGYFGARKGLKSPSGYPIQEGAIIFVRTGQKAIRIGDRLEFDPTRFPSPWPPVKTPISNPG